MNPATDFSSRARGALVGLALGDALSWQAPFHRSHSLPFWTRRLRREIDQASEDTGVLRPQVPFSLNQPPQALAPGPSDDTEWAAFVMRALIDADDPALADASRAAWQSLAHVEGVRGSVATQVALANLRAGLEPPQSGHDNPHYFDDAACARAVPFGVLFAGQPDRAARAAAADAHVTHSDVGVQAAQAVAAGVSAGCGGGNVDALVIAALACLPADGWIRRTVGQALGAAQEAASATDLALRLNRDVVNPEYNYGTAAPETLAVALAVTAYARGQFDLAVLTATAVPKAADAAVPLVGAFCGALATGPVLSDASRDSLRTLAGLCVPSLQGVDYLALVNAWVQRSASSLHA